MKVKNLFSASKINTAKDCMFIITHHITPVSASVCKAVLDLVGENVTALSMIGPPMSHPLFNGYKTMLQEEIRTYITRHDLPQIELLTATSEEGIIVGFMLFGLVQTEVQECNIYYTAVNKEFRRKGIMGKLMQEILQICSAAALSCDVAMVPIYRKYGFRVMDCRETQVVMFFNDPHGITPVIDPADLKRLKAVDDAFRDAVLNANTRDIIRADKDFKSRIQSRKDRARTFVRLNIGQ